MKPVSLYIVEDELLITMSLKSQLESAGYQILGIATKCETCLKELEILRDEGKEPEIVLMDINIRGTVDGIETARRITEQFDCGIIFITGQSSKEIYERSFTVKPFGYLLKPIDLEQTMMIIEIGAYQRQLELENKNYQKKLVKLVEQKTKENQEIMDLYDTLIENSMLGLIVTQDQKFVFVNHEAERIFGYTGDEFRSVDMQQITSLVHPEDRELVTGGETTQGGRIRIIRRDAAVIEVITFVKPVMYGGKPALHQIFFDLSDVS
jgi:PAS domain S-box-containing protein